MLPRLEVVRRLRPVDLVSPVSARSLVSAGAGGSFPLPRPAPYAAVVARPRGNDLTLWLASGQVRLAATWDGRGLALAVTAGATTTQHRSRRRGRTVVAPTRLGLTLTGLHLTAFAEEDGRWVARGRVDLTDFSSRLDPRDPAWLAGLEVGHDGPVGDLVAGGFGQLGLRDLRWVTDADGTPVRDGDALWLSATSAGPGFFDTAHTSVWRFAPDALRLEHTADLFFHRPDRAGVFGDHATHVVRDGGRWLVATSTWGDFEQPRSRADRTRPSTLRAVLAEVADPRHGEHVLDTRELPLPTDGLASLGVWDPHLVRREGRWLVGFVSARRFFEFHPALAAGPALDDLALLGAAADRRATEGTTLLEVDGALVVLASDGRDGRRGQRRGYPVFDLGMAQVGALDAPYPTNIPWPTLARWRDGWVMAAFNGRPAGGDLLGYGTHGDVVVMRSAGQDYAGSDGGHPPS